MGGLPLHQRHPIYYGEDLHHSGKKKFSKIFQKTKKTREGEDHQPQKPVDQATVLMSEMRKRLNSYYQIVLRNVRDFIPKAIGCFLVKKCQTKMEMKLQFALQKNQKVLDLLGEVWPKIFLTDLLSQSMSPKKGRLSN